MKIGILILFMAQIAFCSSYYSFSTRSGFSGPILGTDRVEHNDEVLSILMDEAHKKAANYQRAGNHLAYSAFIVGAFNVLLSESHGVHLRSSKVSGKDCNDEMNSGRMLKEKDPSRGFKAFTDHFLGQGFIQDCRKLRNENSLLMLTSSYVGNDIGIGQINMYWHYDTYTLEKKYLDVRASINFSVNHYYKGFKEILADAQNYDCLMDSSKVNYKSVIRGAWSGKYNEGNTKYENTCRFVLENDSRDTHFLSSLNSLTNIIYDDRYYPLSDQLKNRISPHIKQVLNRSQARISAALVKPSSNEEIIQVTSKRSALRSSPNFQAETCGIIAPLYKVHTKKIDSHWSKLINPREYNMFIQAGHQCDLSNGVYILNDALQDKALNTARSKVYARVFRGEPNPSYFPTPTSFSISSGEKFSFIKKKIDERLGGYWYQITAPHIGWVFLVNEHMENL